ncbi:MAG: NTP pyrophosphohydrolase [Microbacterium sp. 67-17]|uniref:NUDIX domain-containing protein n=1 Tax=Microbacterium sp. 67-17 TaxID=1895782 RepID=UPI00096A2055|nr:NUDIX hydrolase [Microbacterium sp. 67-17]OJV93209.1 MAG: NTP pyrophosphohydrolase [Microbacterium sp. 67-17]
MTIEPPAPGEPRRPMGPRDPGDAWVIAPTGERYWGRFGAAGLLAVDAERGILLQHRVGWSHHGGTWALPGGARHENEDAGVAALREAREEAAVPQDAVRQRFWSVLDLGIWSYTTVIADVIEPFDPQIADAESVALEWVPVEEVAERPLHPGFASAWAHLRPLLSVRPAIVIDAANVVGSVPDGWWRDRAGAAERLLERVRHWQARGVDADALELPGAHWFPEISVVLEGQAKGAAPSADDSGAGIRVVLAPGEGDDEIVAETQRRVASGEQVVVVTSDRGLADRVSAADARVVGAGWLLDQLDDRA